MPRQMIFLSSVQKELAVERRLERADLAAPEFEQDAGTFVERLRRAKRAGPDRGSTRQSGSESGSEWWQQAPTWRARWTAESVHARVMTALGKGALSRSDLAAAIGHTAITRSLPNALADPMSLGFIAYTHPEKPGSRHQEFRSTGPADARPRA